MNENTLVKIYTDLTGTTERTARNVFMLVCSPRGEFELNACSYPGERQRADPNGNATYVGPQLKLAETCDS
jgi:hypothetical protein